jgi:ketosteroid isomerase-like protein
VHAKTDRRSFRKNIFVGWSAVKKYWNENNTLTTSQKVSIAESHIHVNGNLAYEVGQEAGLVTLSGSTPWNCRGEVCSTLPRVPRPSRLSRT